MLVPNTIPNKEPEINVGIVLPEDKLETLEIGVPENEAYNLLINGAKKGTISATTLQLKLKGTIFEVEYKNGTKVEASELVLSPSQKSKTPFARSGLHLTPVIAGRGFHWQKKIDVYLPDRVIIRIYNGALIVINQLPLEHYVMCVATSEMSAACPPALIESQTIAARSWLLANVEQKHRAMEMDICNDDCCQRYQGTTFLTEQSIEGALNTAGKVLASQNIICDARYSKSCGGMMETFAAVWGGEEIPYMQAIVDAKTDILELKGSLKDEQNANDWIKAQPHTFCSPQTISENELKQYIGNVDEEGSYFRWDITVMQEELLGTLKRFAGVEAKEVTALNPLERGASSRIIKLDMQYLDKNDTKQSLILDSEYKVRQYLSAKFLYSSALSIQKIESGEITKGFNLKGAGWGHGAGLCQIGALGMALNNYSTEVILEHYYPTSELKKIY